MLEFKSLGSYVIEGRGKVFIVGNDRDRKVDSEGRGDFEDLYPKIKIDGVEMSVAGIESKGMIQREGCHLGILIKGEKNEY